MLSFKCYPFKFTSSNSNTSIDEDEYPDLMPILFGYAARNSEYEMNLRCCYCFYGNKRYFLNMADKRDSKMEYDTGGVSNEVKVCTKYR